MGQPQRQSPLVGPYRWADFVALPDDDRRELVDGHLLEIDMPTWLHEWIVLRIATSLDNWSDAGRRGFVVPSGYKVKVTETRGAMPDVQFFLPGNRPPNDSTGLTSGRPDLAVEVVSPTSERFDRVAKLQYYAGIGIPEYWIVDAGLKAIDRHVLVDGTYVRTERVDGATFEPESFAGLSIPLVRLFDPDAVG